MPLNYNDSAKAVYVSRTSGKARTGQQYASVRVVSALFVLLLLSVGFLNCFGQGSVVTTNLQFGQDGQTHSFKIATLNQDDAGDADHIHLVATLNTGDAATANMYIDATFANRAGFHYLYTLRGASNSPNVRLVAYQSSVGAAVDIYIVLINFYNQASYTILEALDETIYQTPSDTLGSLPSASTIVFDSNNPAYLPVTYSNFQSQFGVGTAAPQKMLSVAGNMNVDQNDANNGSDLDLSFGYASGEGFSSSRVLGAPNQYGLDFFTGFNRRLSITQGGAVGIGTTNPSAPLEVVGNVKINGVGSVLTFPDGSTLGSASAFTTLGGSFGGLVISGANLDPNAYGTAAALNSITHSGKMLLGFNRSAGDGEQDFVSNNTVGARGGFAFYNQSDSGALTNLATISSGGLALAGNIGLSNGGHVNFADGTQQSTAWTGTLSGGDYAESVDVTEMRSRFEPGDLLVIDPLHAGSFMKSSRPYSTLIGGVYASKPGVTGRRQPREKPQDTEVPMAMVGIVPTKISAENGPVHVGDLLVSSSTAGYAMKGTDRNLLTGAVLGKALGSLETGTGVVEVLISLQ